MKKYKKYDVNPIVDTHPVATKFGPIATCPPCFCPGELTDAERENVPIWTGEGYETYGTIKRRGYRFNPNEQF